MVRTHFSESIVVQKAFLLLGVASDHFHLKLLVLGLQVSARITSFAAFIEDAGEEVLLLVGMSFLPVLDHILAFNVEKSLISVRFDHHFDQGL